jgi:hypothetical protein
LTQAIKPAPCWFDGFNFHPCRVAGLNTQASTFSTSCGMAARFLLAASGGRRYTATSFILNNRVYL